MPERGEVWQVDFGVTAKVRPALVISLPYADADRALIGVIPHTTATRGSQFEVVVPARFLARAHFWFRAFRRFRRDILCGVLEFSPQRSFRALRTVYSVGSAS